MLPVRPLLLPVAALLLASCQVARVPSSDDPSGLARSEAWRAGFRSGKERLAAKPGWNAAPAVPAPGGDLRHAATSYSSVPGVGPFLAMTFDDGPHPSHTPRLLDLLKARNIKATFFVVGPNAKAHPQILKRMVAEGHEIANHTWSHCDITKVSADTLRRELDDTRDAIVAATGVPPRTFRPPYGASSSSLKTLIKSEYGYPSIYWSVDPEDWKRPGVSVVADRLVSGARNGGILLAHDIHQPTIDAMPSALDRLLAKGFRFVTVTQLIELGRSAAPAE
jgi:peptidoglycan/xylan/chitin deacetylase (PgdA/CDA1 family)